MRNKSLFRKNITSGIIVLLIPVLVSITVYILLFSFLQYSVSKSEKITFNSVTTTFEQNLNNTFTNLHWIAIQENFRTVSESEAVDDKAFKDLRNNLVNIKGTDFIDKICVIFDSFVITNESYRTITQFYSDDFFSYGIGEQTIKNNFAKNPAFLFEFYPEKPASVCYISIRYGSIKADVLLYMSNNKLKSHLKNITQYENGGIFLSDSRGNALFAGDSATEKSFKISGKSVSAYLSKEKYQHHSSGDTGLVYYFFIPDSNYGGIYIGIQALLIVSIILSLGIAVILTVFNVKKTVRPVIQLKEKLVNFYPDDSQSFDNEFEAIERNLDKLINSNRDYESRLERNKYVLANNIFIRILRNLPLGDSLENICEEYGLKLFGKKITVLAVDSRNIREYLEQLTPQDALHIKESISLDRQRLAAETFGEFEKHYVVDAEEYSYLILLSDCNKSDDVILEKIKRCAKQYQAKANEYYTVYLSFGISNTVDTPFAIHRAYRQAEEARSFGLLLGSDNEIISYGQIHASRNEQGIGLTNYKELRDYIREKNFDKAEEKLNEILDISFAPLGQSEIRIHMYSLIEKLITEISDAVMYFDNTFLEKLDFRNRLMAVASLEALRAAVTDIFKVLRDYVADNASGNSEWIEGVKNYINHNFADINLNVGYLADKFNFNLSYFSHIFKKETGKGVFDYIQERRIAQAKELLKQNKTVNEVAVSVGYLDSRTFIRTFKKYEGDTPSKFKRK